MEEGSGPSTVPLPTQVADGKYYLPAFNLVATVPTQVAAEYLEAGLMSLIQYRGNPTGFFNLAMGRELEDKLEPFDSSAPACTCVVALATRLQLFASVTIGNGDEDAERLLNMADGSPLEPWEIDYLNATAAFLRYDFEGSTAACLANIRKHPFDGFSARLLLIAAYFGEDMEALAEGFCAITDNYEEAIIKQVEESLERKHALHLALPSFMAWAAFGLEETRRDVQRAEELANRAIELTTVNNRFHFPTGTPSRDAPGRRGALASVDDDVGFTCVFGVHVVCHCFEHRGDARGGLDFVQSTAPALWQPAKHLAGHIWWHVALFQLEAGLIDNTLATYQSYLAAPPPGDPFALADSGSLLLRMWLWSCWFQAAPVAGSAETWSAETISAAAQSQVAQGLLTLDEHWQTHAHHRIAPFPFFAAHKYMAHAAAAWVDRPGSKLRPWPIAALPLPVGTTTQASHITDGRIRRDVLVASLRAGSERLQAAGAATDPASATEGFVGGVAEWLAIIDQLSPPKPISLAVRARAASAPMGGSVAQQRLISTTLLLLLLFTGRRREAFTALQAMCLQQPKSRFLRGVRIASGL